jgi:hypothetical protein
MRERPFTNVSYEQPHLFQFESPQRVEICRKPSGGEHLLFGFPLSEAGGLLSANDREPSMAWHVPYRLDPAL